MRYPIVYYILNIREPRRLYKIHLGARLVCQPSLSRIWLDDCYIFLACFFFFSFSKYFKAQKRKRHFNPKHITRTHTHMHAHIRTHTHAHTHTLHAVFRFAKRQDLSTSVVRGRWALQWQTTLSRAAGLMDDDRRFLFFFFSSTKSFSIVCFFSWFTDAPRVPLVADRGRVHIVAFAVDGNSYIF